MANTFFPSFFLKQYFTLFSPSFLSSHFLNFLLQVPDRTRWQNEDEHLSWFPFPSFSSFYPTTRTHLSSLTRTHLSPGIFFFPIWKWEGGLFRLSFSVIFFPFSFILPPLLSPSSSLPPPRPLLLPPSPHFSPESFPHRKMSRLRTGADAQGGSSVAAKSAPTNYASLHWLHCTAVHTSWCNTGSVKSIQLQ